VQFSVAQSDLFRINVYLDKVTYTPLDGSVRVTGCLLSEGTSVLGRQVSIVVQAPGGEVVVSETATADDSCNFEFNFDTRGLSEYGDYSVVATHETASDKKAFRFSDTNNVKQEGECADRYCPFSFELQGGIYEVQYKVTAGTLHSIIVDLPARSLMFLVNSTESNGTLTALLPIDVIDSSQNGTDIRYKVFIGSLDDGVEHVAHEEFAATENERGVVVDYPASDERILISIKGTYLVPEFGPLLVAAIAIMGFVIPSRFVMRFRYRNAA